LSQILRQGILSQQVAAFGINRARTLQAPKATIPHPKGESLNPCV